MFVGVRDEGKVDMRIGFGEWKEVQQGFGGDWRKMQARTKCEREGG